MTWQTVVTEPSELGESPFWHPHEQRLYWIDIVALQILRAGLLTSTLQRWAMPSEPGCIAPAVSGGLVIALRDGIYRAPIWGGELTLLARAEHDIVTTRFNDGRADPLGRFWAGTIYEPRDRPLAALYSLDCRPASGGAAPRLQRQAGDALTANGLAWSPDAKTLYWSDTPRHVTHAWDWDAGRNVLTRRRVFRQFSDKPAGWHSGMPGYGGRPDGAAVDAQGNYWCAMYEGRRLLQLSPAGELLADIPVPAQCPTMPCFGGANLRTLYLTSARHGRPAAELAALPLSGCVFSMRVEVPGLPVNFFRD